MLNKEFQIQCYTKHFFKDTKYILLIQNKTISLTNEAPQILKKYELCLDWDTIVSWKVSEDQKLEAIGFMVEKNKIKYFYSQHDQLVTLKNIISKQVMFTAITNFFKYQNQLQLGSRSEIVQIKRILDGSEDYVAKCYERQQIEKNPEIKKAFYRELTLLAKFDHPNIVKMFEVYRGDETIYLILEKIKGQSIHDLIKQANNQLNFALIRYIMQELLKTIIYIQYQNILHRNLHPKNILLTQNNKLMLINFNNSIQNDFINQNVSNKGYPGYIAPELLNNPTIKDKVNPKVDIFAIGAIFYKLLVRKDLFPGQNQFEILQANKLAQFDLTKLQYMKIPIAALNLLENLLKLDPNERISAQAAIEHELFTNDLKVIQSQKKIKSTKKIIDPIDEEIKVDYFTTELPSLNNIPIMEKVKGGNRDQ